MPILNRCVCVCVHMFVGGVGVEPNAWHMMNIYALALNCISVLSAIFDKNFQFCCLRHCCVGVLTAGSGSSLPGLDPHCRVGSGSVLPGRGPHPLYSSVLPYLKCSDMSLFSINMNWLSANLNKGRGTRQLILVEHEGLMQWCHSVSDWFTRWS